MKQLYTYTVLLAFLLQNNFCAFSQITWQKNNGSTGQGSFTISGTGSVNSLNSSENIALLKHSTAAGTFYTCNNCTLNIQINGEFVFDFPVYFTNSKIIVGQTAISTSNNTASIYVLGSSSNPKQAIFLDNASSIQLVGASNFILLENLPTAYVYFDYTGAANSAPATGSKFLAGTSNSPLCGISSSNNSNYTCNQGQMNGPSILNASGLSVIQPLPVVLVDFSATLNSNNTIGLDWSTQVEVNLSHFTVERSADGSNWDAIGTVQAKGNSGTTTNYSFTDPNPLSGFNYYRLEMADLDNRTGLTEIVLVRTSIIKPFTIFPNPARDYVDITLSKAINGNVLLYNQLGQLLQQKQVNISSDGTTVSLQFFSYPAGTYIIQVIGSDGSKEVGKLLITK